MTRPTSAALRSEATDWSHQLHHSQLPNGLSVWEINRHETEFLYAEIFQQDLYFQRGIELRPDAVVFDVGANIGMFSMRVRQRCPQATIFAFEPSPIAAEALSRNTVSETGKTHIYECGLSGQCGSSVFTFYPGYSILSGFHAQQVADCSVLRASIRDEAERRGISKWLSNTAIDRLAQQKLGEPLRLACPLMTLSSVINESHVRRIDLLKIDAEKCELEILQGITAAHWPLIRQIVMEVHDQDGEVLPVIKELLLRNGFELHVDHQTHCSEAGLFDVYAVRHDLSG